MAETIVKNAPTKYKEILVIFIGQIIATVPKIKLEFTTTDPITLPKTISLFPVITDFIPKTSSGKAVPNETKIIPKNNNDILTIFEK